MKNKTYLPKVMTKALFLICLGAIQIFAQNNTQKPFIEKGVFWSDQETGTEVYLFRKISRGYRLTVFSKQSVSVGYRTEINSSESVYQELKPLESSCRAIKYFEFEHSFSRRTIWMALDFTVGGKKIPALARTFYNDIFEVVPNEQFSERFRKNSPETVWVDILQDVGF
jgi:hypothetical protein